MRYCAILLFLLAGCFATSYAASDSVNRHGNQVPPVSASNPVRAVLTLTFGWDWAQAGDSQSVLLLTTDPAPDRFDSDDRTSSVPMGGAFIGVEFPFSRPDIRWQVGVGYYAASSYEVAGIDYFYTLPDMGNKKYSYSLLSQRLLIENKLLFNMFPNPFINSSPIYVYVSAGAGAALNKSYHYEETIIDPTTSGLGSFASKNVYAFTYMVGAGLDAEFGSVIRLGLGYRFLDLGESSLGDYNLADTNNTISTDNIYVNEAVLQMSVLF